MNMAVRPYKRRVNKLRIRAMEMVRAWSIEMESLGAPTTHPLDSVRTFALDDRRQVGGYLRPGRVYAKETRPSGRSRIPIRELSLEADRTNLWLKTVREIADGNYYRAVVFWCHTPDFDEMARILKWSKTAALRNFDCGIAVLQAKILDEHA